MTSLIKNQILKHLSKLAKNLNPDKIQLSTLRGEGDLSNLELDEDVMMSLLELPTWLRLTKATCNRLSIKIQWTKLKTQPICLIVDEILVEMETCEEPRKPNLATPDHGYNIGGKYGLSEKIVDGMFVSINNVAINFRAKAFLATFQLSRIQISSKTPLWQTGDLRLTRIKDDLRGEILIFKEAEWQTLRIEANALDSSETTPLRLIANQSKTRITIKKRLADCMIIATRVQFNLDDLLWVLTDSQLKAALIFANSLKDVLKKAEEQNKHLVVEKLKKQGIISNSNSLSASTLQQRVKNASRSQQAVYRLFSEHEVIESSYHVLTGRIDLHLCEDTLQDGRQTRMVEGGALQVTLYKLQVDIHPFHPAGADRTNFMSADENSSLRDSWSEKLLSQFMEDAKIINKVFNVPADSQTQERQSSQNKTSPGKYFVGGFQLMENCTILRLENFNLFQVSSANLKRQARQKFLFSDKKALRLPSEMSAMHFEIVDYYFPDAPEMPVPNSQLFIVINPLEFYLDFVTVVWLNAFCLSILENLRLPEFNGPSFHRDVKISALMPKVVLPCDNRLDDHRDRPHFLKLLASQLTITNCHVEPSASLDKLYSDLEFLSNSPFVRSCEFPRSASDLEALPSFFKTHAKRQDQPYINPAVNQVLAGLPDAFADSDCNKLDSTSMFMDSLNDVWCCSAQQFWADFSCGNPDRIVSFIDAVPLSVWLGRPIEKPSKSVPALADLHMLLQFGAKLRLQLNHYQYVFLLRLVESIALHQIEIEADTAALLHKSPTATRSFVMTTSIPSVELSVISPSMQPVNDDIPVPEEECLDSALGNGLLSFGGSQTFQPNTNSLSVPADNIGKSCSDNEIHALQVIGLPSHATDPHLSSSPRLSRSGAIPLSTSPKMDLKNTFSFAFNSFGKISDKFSKSVRSTGDEGSEWDAMSVLADSDDEDYAVLKLCHQKVQPAFERRHDSFSESEKEFSQQSQKYNPMVSVATWCLFDVHAAVCIEEADITCSMQCCSVSVMELGDMRLDNFQSQFSSLGIAAGKLATPPVQPQPSCLKLRYMKGVRAGKMVVEAEERGLLQLRADKIHLSASSSNLLNLIDMMDDEIEVQVMPLFILANHCSVQVQSDKPRQYPTSAKTAPIAAKVASIIVERGVDGILRVRAIESAERTRTSSKDLESRGRESREKEWHGRRGEQKVERETVMPEREGRSRDGVQPAAEHGSQQPQPSVDADQQNLGNKGASSTEKLLNHKEKMCGECNDRSRLLLVQHTEIARLQERARVMDRDHCVDIARMTEIKMDNAKLYNQVTHQHEYIVALKQERESLLKTIHSLQEDLSTSEIMRVRQQQSN